MLVFSDDVSKMCYLSIGNKVGDQLHGRHVANLHLCFHIKRQVFSWRGSFTSMFEVFRYF